MSTPDQDVGDQLDEAAALVYLEPQNYSLSITVSDEDGNGYQHNYGEEQ